jgi:hypothetical protein
MRKAGPFGTSGVLSMTGLVYWLMQIASFEAGNSSGPHVFGRFYSCHLVALAGTFSK